MSVIQVWDKKFKPFIDVATIDATVQKIAERINVDYKDKNPLLLAVLNGAFIFAGDLMRKLTIPCEISFVKYSSYSGVKSTEEVRELIGIGEEITGRHVIIVEDIVDTGITMDNMLTDIRKRNPIDIKIACFCFKPAAFQKSFPIDYLGLSIPNDFIVGYGLDYDRQGRNLKEIYKIAE
jgi:hypoxanthine phosphoribosyltransferase